MRNEVRQDKEKNDIEKKINTFFLKFHIGENKDGKINRMIDRQMDRQIDRWIDRQIDG